MVCLKWTLCGIYVYSQLDRDGGKCFIASFLQQHATRAYGIFSSSPKCMHKLFIWKC
ncbi:hypothetical protein X975_25146, partial [Stegodyphus mimosarum]